MSSQRSFGECVLKFFSTGLQLARIDGYEKACMTDKPAHLTFARELVLDVLERAPQNAISRAVGKLSRVSRPRSLARFGVQAFARAMHIDVKGSRATDRRLRFGARFFCAQAARRRASHRSTTERFSEPVRRRAR